MQPLHVNNYKTLPTSILVPNNHNNKNTSFSQAIITHRAKLHSTLHPFQSCCMRSIPSPHRSTAPCNSHNPIRRLIQTSYTPYARTMKARNLPYESPYVYDLIPGQRQLRTWASDFGCCEPLSDGAMDALHHESPPSRRCLRAACLRRYARCGA